MRHLRHLALILFIVISSNSFSNGLVPTYSLNECVVKVDLLWPKNADHSLKSEVFNQTTDLWNRAIASGKYPLFSQHSTSSMNYFVMYFAQLCEKREELAQEIIKNELQSKIPNFPKYEVTAKGFQIGFDGVNPSGWWVDK